MTVTLTYLNGDTVPLQHVQAITIAGPHQVIVRCFGNDDVTHRDVYRIDPEPFVFPLPKARHRVVCVFPDGARRTIGEFDNQALARLEAMDLNVIARDIKSPYEYEVEPVEARA
jgi:hypothetical protein